MDQCSPGHEFQIGDQLEGDVDCTVVEVTETSIRLDKKVSRKEAASLGRVDVSLDPAVLE